MAKKNKIVYGKERADYNVTSMVIDNNSHVIECIIGNGLKVETIRFTMEQAQIIGLINIEVLLD